MRSNAGMGNRQEDVDSDLPPPSQHFGLVWPEIIQRLHQVEDTSLSTIQFQHQEGLASCNIKKH